MRYEIITKDPEGYIIKFIDRKLLNIRDEKMLKTLYIITIFMIVSSFAIAFEYKSATEDDIKKLFEEIKAKPGTELTRRPYKIIIADVYENTTYYFTDAGHFAHPSVVIERRVVKEERGKPYPDIDLVGMTAREREHIEKWIQVIKKPYTAMKRMQQEVDPRPICEKYDLQSRPKESVKCYEKVAQDNPDSMTAQEFLGSAYIYADDEMSTRKQYEILLKHDAQQAFFFMGFGVAVLKPEWMGYYEERHKKVQKVLEAQELLDSLGYETGLLVGAVGPELEAAIRAFQRDANLPVNGEVTESLLEKLRTWKK